MDLSDVVRNERGFFSQPHRDRKMQPLPAISHDRRTAPDEVGGLEADSCAFHVPLIVSRRTTRRWTRGTCLTRRETRDERWEHYLERWLLLRSACSSSRCDRSSRCYGVPAFACIRERRLVARSTTRLTFPRLHVRSTTSTRCIRRP